METRIRSEPRRPLLGVVDVEFVRTDAHNWSYDLGQHLISEAASRVSKRELTVLLMHLRNLPCILPTLDDVVIEFEPERQCSKLRTRKLGQGAEVQSMYRQASIVYQKTACQQGETISRDQVHCEMSGVGVQNERSSEVDNTHLLWMVGGFFPTPTGHRGAEVRGDNDIPETSF